MSTPAKRIEDMTPEERLASLKSFAEEKKYVRPGEDGTLPRGPGAMQALVFGGPLTTRTTTGREYDHALPPPAYETVVGGEKPAPVQEKKAGLVRRWVEKRREDRGGDGDGKERGGSS